MLSFGMPRGIFSLGIGHDSKIAHLTMTGNSGVSKERSVYEERFIIVATKATNMATKN